MYKELEDFFQGVTFDDILLRPQKGRLYHRRDADLAMPLTRNIVLKGVPVMPANMRTVTGSKMVAAAALEGSIGFLPRSYSIKDQSEKAGFVKGLQAHVIENPLVIHRKATLAEARKMIREKKISGILVGEISGSRVLAGILSNRDLSGPDSGLVEDFMTPFEKVVYGGIGTTIEEAEKVMNWVRKEKLPLIDEKRNIVGLITMKDLKRAKQKPYSSKDSKGRLMVGATIGADKDSDYMERMEALVHAEVDVVLMDVAHAHSIYVEEAVKNVKIKFPDVELIVGNVATREGARFLIELGADAIKVGIGPGSGCRTRIETGFGVGQLQAIREARLEIFKSGATIIADGGINFAGDISKAIAVGADTVMMGSIFAGADEAPGIKYEHPETKLAMKKYGGETSPEVRLSEYSEEEGDEELFEQSRKSEGQSKDVPSTGKVEGIFNRIRFSLQSAVSYSGAARLSEFHDIFSHDILKKIDRLTVAAQKESNNR